MVMRWEVAAWRITDQRSRARHLASDPVQWAPLVSLSLSASPGQLVGRNDDALRKLRIDQLIHGVLPLRIQRFCKDRPHAQIHPNGVSSTHKKMIDALPTKW